MDGRCNSLTKIRYFPGIETECLKRPILYSNWLSKDYVPVERESLREYVKARLKVFYEEELDVPLVLFNEVLDRITHDYSLSYDTFIQLRYLTY